MIDSQFQAHPQMSKLPVVDNSALSAAEDLLGFIKSLPGAGKAIVRLVGGLGDAGARVARGFGDAGAATMDIATAKAQGKAARIRGETKSQEKIRAALTRAALRHIEGTPEMGERALERLAGDVVRKQANTEAVVVKALEQLREDPPKQHRGEPDDDWLNIFGAHAERASSEFMREHWARVLSGEIRQPGSFSYATLHLISLMSPKIASLITKVGTWVVDGRIVFNSTSWKEGRGYEDLMLLGSIGFLTMNHSMFLNVNGNAQLKVRTRHYDLVADFKLDGRAMFSCSYLTLAGEELYPILDFDENVVVPGELSSFLRENGALEISTTRRA